MKSAFSIRALGLAACLSISAAVWSAPPPEMVPLPTGSRLATWTLQGDAVQHRDTPVVFLHGGPGFYTSPGRFDEGAMFRKMGFDTVYFDQAGGGRSDRLPAAEYSLDRTIADLEALRIHLGRDRIILWANSFGADIATVYASRHPEHVRALILTSPGMFPGFKPRFDYSLTNQDKVPYDSETRHAIDTIRRQGAAAERDLSQETAGRLFDRLLADGLINGIVCKGASVKLDVLPGGGNLYAHLALVRDVEEEKLAARATAGIPTLILRGSCDFIPMKSAERYRRYFDGTLVPIDHAGHGLLEQPAAVERAISGFLAASGIAEK